MLKEKYEEFSKAVADALNQCQVQKPDGIEIASLETPSLMVTITIEDQSEYYGGSLNYVDGKWVVDNQLVEFHQEQ